MPAAVNASLNCFTRGPSTEPVERNKTLTLLLNEAVSAKAPPQTVFISSRGFAEILRVEREPIYCERCCSHQLFLRHHGATGSRGLDSPRRLRPVPEVAVFLSL